MPGRRSARIALGLLCVAAAQVLAQQPSAAAPAQDFPEYVVKAGFLYNFAKYVEWPADAFASPAAPIVVGIVGSDPFGAELDRTLQNKTVDGRAFEIHRYREAAEIQPVHILFVSRSERARLASILGRVQDAPVLTVGEHEGFSLAGGVITILIEAQKPRLQINPDAARHKRMTIDAKLLQIATIVASAGAP